MRGWRRVSFATFGLAVGALSIGGCGADTEPIGGASSRVLVVSMPGVSWADVEDGALPTVRAFAEGAAVANLATRIGRVQAPAEAAYLTIGAGTRAVAPEGIAGVALGPGESYHGQPAAEVVERRTGRAPNGLTYLGIGAARSENDASRFGAAVGLLGSLLAEGGVNRAVIANADLRRGSTDDLSYGRSAVAALMDADGQVPAGEVSTRLLVEDPESAYGVRLDHGVVLGAFDRVWGESPVVVLVEASDLLRAEIDGPSAAPGPRRAMRDRALAEADVLFAELLMRVGDADAVILLAPVAPGGGPHLGVVAVRAPGQTAGLLRSATTRRSGYVQLGDLAPTILQLVGLDPPEEVEGRPFTVLAGGGSNRIGRLAEGASAAAFRDDVLPLTVVGLIVLLVLLVAATVVARRSRWPRGAATRGRAFAVIRFGALAALGALPATFLAGPAGLGGGPTAGYAAFLAGVGGVLATGASLADRRWRGIGPVLAVAVVAAVIVVDVLVGAPLQLNSTFGYSVAVAGRFAGLGNLAFALLGSAAVVLAALLAERGGPRGVRLALAVLAAVALADGLPMFGGDVGGILSMVPAFGLAGFVLLGRRIGIRAVAAVMSAAVGMLVAVTFLDLARPPDSQTHLARLADHVVDGRWEPLVDSVGRRWTASFGSGQVGAWVVLVVVALGVTGYLVLVRSGVAGPRPDRRAPGRWAPGGPVGAAAVGLGVLGTVGVVANDSSFVVPATMLLVVAPVLVYRAVVEVRP